MDVLRKRLHLREQQILDMRTQISDIMLDSSKLDNLIEETQKKVAAIEEKIHQKDLELENEFRIKEKGLLKLQELENYFEKSTTKKKPEKNQDVATAYIEFYTRTIQEKPMFKKLPEFNEEPEPPSSPLKVNDVELDEELEKLGLSDVLKKYS